jgi:hypothetical protein
MSNLTFVSKYRHLRPPGQVTILAKLVPSKLVGPIEKRMQANQGVSLHHESDSFGLGTMVCASVPGPSMSSASPLIPSLNPRRPAPSPLPSSGSLFPPNWGSIEGALSQHKARSTELSVSGLERLARSQDRQLCRTLLSAGGRCMLRGVSFCRCFDSAGINTYAIFLTLNPNAIEIVRIPIFLEGDSRIAVR